ncbi:MAG: bacillithiol system redox-active protein YtxJ [Deinococcota bacterium]
MRTLQEQGDIDRLLEHSEREPVILFKHSATCPISAFAHKQLEELEDTVPIYKLTVQRTRALSNSIAEDFEVQHQTPQAIVILAREVQFDSSHGDVSEHILKPVLDKLRQ